MTSSLVGSEMCIRDSNGCGSVEPCCLRLRVSHRVLRLCAGSVAACCVRPVSYTHLTLPTICSV
eukprot:7161690-Prorocentrum_lima.AAC.1